ncbi:MAG: roadblock/LC7 domain-containing protein [Candidatus Thorarchaeota archaeon]
MNDEFVIPPLKMIKSEVANFVQHIPIWTITLFTVDGYVLEHRSNNMNLPQEIELIISSMSAGLITIAEDMIRMVDHSKLFSQVIVDSENVSDNENFSILLRQIADNILLACVFPNSTHLGLITFEIQELTNRIRDIVSQWDIKLHEETMT